MCSIKTSNPIHWIIKFEALVEKQQWADYSNDDELVLRKLFVSSISVSSLVMDYVRKEK